MAASSKRCVIECLGVHLVREWVQTGNEYLGFVRKPCGTIAPKQLVKCQQESYEIAFQEWSVIQFWVSLLVACACAVRDVLEGQNILALAIEATWRVVLAYVLAHLSWFGVVKRDGCCCFFIVCCEAPLLLLLWGALCVFYGLLSSVWALVHVFACPLCIIPACLTAIQAMILIYMGLCALQIWKKRGADIVPPAVEVKGPEGTVVGQQNIA